MTALAHDIRTNPRLRRHARPIRWLAIAASIALLAIFGVVGTSPALADDSTEDAGASSIVHVKLRSSAQVPGWNLTVADVASIEGGDAEHRDSIAATRLGLAPSAGEVYRVSAAFVASKLLDAGHTADNLRVGGAATTVVRPVVTRIAGSRLQRGALDALAEALATDDPRLRVEILAETTPRDVMAPAGVEGVSITYHPRSTVLRPGIAWVDARLRVDGRALPSVAISFRIRMVGEVLTAKRSIARDETLDASNLELTLTELTRSGSARALTDFRDIEGRIARRPLAAGEVLTARDAYRPFTVRRGDSVTMLLDSGPLRVSTEGVVDANGYEGQEIPVRNARSGRTVRALVVDAKTVRVGTR